MRAASARSWSSLPGSGSAVWRRWYSRLKLASSTHSGRPVSSGGTRELLAVARDEVQPAAHVVGEVVERRRRALEDHDGADVHVGVLALLGQERRVHRREPIAVCLSHAAINVPQNSAAASPPATEAISTAVSTAS